MALIVLCSAGQYCDLMTPMNFFVLSPMISTVWFSYYFMAHLSLNLGLSAFACVGHRLSLSRQKFQMFIAAENLWSRRQCGARATSCQLPLVISHSTAALEPTRTGHRPGRPSAVRQSLRHHRGPHAQFGFGVIAGPRGVWGAIDNLSCSAID